MSEGKALQVASPKELYNRPVSVEVADFIGQMNFVDATVVDVGDGRALLDTAGLGRIRAPVSGDFVSSGARVVVAIRPEMLSLSIEHRPEGANAVQGIVEAAAYLGDRSHYHINVDGADKPLAVATQEAETSLAHSLDSGTTVWLTWSDEAVLVLPRP